MREIQPISAQCVWHGREMANSPRWRRRLGDAQLAEIDLAVRQARARGLGWQNMTADDFPLPSFSALAEEIRAELEDGSGIVLLQGLDPSPYSLGELSLLYAAISRQIGTFVYSNRAGEIMREIRDVGRDGGRAAVQRYGALPESEGAFLSSYARTLSNGALRFHTDRCDVVALFCVRQPARGRLSQLCSSPAVHNAMLERRPDLCAALYQDLWRSRFGEEDATNQSAYPLPVWGVRDGKFTSAEELCFEMSFAPGDIQFVNNHVIYHARSTFEDDDQGHDRLLMRLWLSMPNSRTLPVGHEVLWRAVEAGALRGGIGQSGVPV